MHSATKRQFEGFNSGTDRPGHHGYKYPSEEHSDIAASVKMALASIRGSLTGIADWKQPKLVVSEHEVPNLIQPLVSRLSCDTARYRSRYRPSTR